MAQAQCCLESVLSAEAAYSPQDVTVPRLVRLSGRLGVARLREVLGNYWNVVALSLNQLKCSGFFFPFPYCAALAGLELIMYARLVSNSQISQQLTPKC